jgi:lysophospholipase L1-like esterase
MSDAKRVAAWVLAATVSGAAISFAFSRIRRRMAANSATLNETLPIHSKWWRDRAKERGDLLYAALGDSAAQGIGASSPDRSYVGVVAEAVARATGRTIRIVNLSGSGARVRDAIELQLPRLARLEPDLVTVAIGANDIAEFDAKAFEVGIRKIFDALPPHSIVADLPYFYLPWNESKVAEANRIVRSIAAERELVVAPLHATTKRAGIAGIATHFAIDFFHPNDRGYRVWASAFLPAVLAAPIIRAAQGN